MSAPDDVSPPTVDEDSRSRGSKPSKEKKRRRRSRSKQKETPEPQFLETEFAEDDGNNSNSSTPQYERPEELAYPAGGLKCALCYCGEKSLLGQGDLTRYSPSAGFNPFKKPPLRARGSRELLYGSSPGSNGSQESFAVCEKVTKTAAQRRGSKQMREPVKTVPKQQDHVDELSTVGCSEMLEVGQVFESTGHVSAHHCCAAWSEGVTQNESYNLLCVDKAVHAGMSQRCHYCSRYGATIKCRGPKCERLFHYPCAAGSGCFQDIKSMSLLCTDHLELAPTIADPDELNCAVCDSPGQISDLLFCTSCGHHYHGDCLDPHVDVNPVVRAGWQCPECKICQTCRQPGDDNKMLVCDVCDKGYHTFCLKPPMIFIPKNGWCCKICRRCKDCGSRTPGNGPSSRWHINYQVCDSCYQLRNKGHSCPVCGRAYRNIPSARAEMMQCATCKKYVHAGCEEQSQLEECQKQPDDYKCPKCRNPELASSEMVPEPAAAARPVTPIRQVEGALDLSFSTPPPESSMLVEGESMAQTQEMVELKAEPVTFGSAPLTSPLPMPRKRASTSSSIGSEKGNLALKGSSLDPMLCVGEDSSIGDPHSLGKLDLASPPRKVRHISSDEALSARDKASHHSSAESNISSLFTDENAQDTMSLFGVDALPQSAPRSLMGITPSGMVSPDAKTFKITDGFVSPSQPKVSLSPLASPQSYESPPVKPPGPGIGKPGAMFGKGKPFGHKRKPATAKSRGKGKGKGQKRGSFSGARKRPKGGKGSATVQTTERNLPRRARRSFQRQVSASPSVGEESLASPITKMEPVLQIAHADDEYGDSMHNTVVLCSTEDTFTLSQDMCVVCGSFGKGSEGRLIACSQCGQCYHPYCVNLKLTKVVLRKGWRCLDCTVCEECGQVDDPAHLLLCDDCDISYHTHCLKPPLQHVPKGGWKCKWCVRCIHCGTTSPGKNCEWAANYTSCGPCASLHHCIKCKRSYKDEDIIMQCGTCERWIHAVCEFLFTESDIEKVLEKGYECCFCRPKDATPPHQLLGSQHEDPNYGAHSGVYMGRTRSEVEAVKEYHKDCTALTIAGLQHIQRQMQKHMGLHKKRPAAVRGRSRKPSDNQEKLQTPPVLPTLQNIKEKEPSLGQTINVAAAVTALQDPSEVYRKISGEGIRESPDVAAVPLSQLPVSTGAAEDLSSATATATEDSAMEGIERDLTPMRPEDLKSPIADVDSNINKSEEFAVETAIPGPTKTVPGVQQGGIKRRRKPYRPGIGGFTVRQRSRGGLFKPRRRRSLQPLGQAQNKDTSEGSKTTDTATTEAVSDAVVSSAPGHPPISGLPSTTAGNGAAAQPGVEQGALQFSPPANLDPLAAVGSPIKIKLPTTSSSSKPRRKKKPKLIEQFPPYLQDAFFGKDILTAAENKASAFDNMNERPASPSSGYAPKHDDSRLTLPDRLTQRLEAQVSQTAASHSHGIVKSQRHPSQPQDEEAMLMDRENEQELLGVLPDLPFKDDELLGMISSELKQEHGASDSHENILSPSSLEKMVRDGLDGLQNIDSDVAALFSDVLNQQSEATTKQDSHSGVHGSSQQEEPSQIPHNMHQDVQPSMSNVQHSSMQMQQTPVANQQQTEQQQQMAIQQELQQIEMKQRQQQLQRQHAMHRQMSATGYPMTQQDQTMQGQHILNINQGRGMPGSSVTPSPHGMSMVGQHLDPSRPRSHHTTPVMSPVPMGALQQTHPLAQLHPGHSPHPTPPPPPMFARQTSMPILPGMQNQGMQSDIMGTQQMHPQPTGQIPQGMIGHQIAPSPGPLPLQGHVANLATSTMTTSSVKTVLQGTEVISRPVGLYPEQPPSSMNQTPSIPHSNINPNFTQSSNRMQNQPQQMPHTAGYQGSVEPPRRPSIPPEAYLVTTSAITPSGSTMGLPTAATHKRSSSVPVVTQSSTTPGPVVSTAARMSQPVQPPARPLTSENVTPTTQPLVSSDTGIIQNTQSSDGMLVPQQLPNFQNDTNIFEPSPPPWPLGTEIDGESPSVNQRNIQKWEKDEPLGDRSTISPVLFANVKYPDLKKEFPDWQARVKQISKLWRKATSEERAPFLLRAKDNRALLKSSRTRKDDASKTPTPPVAGDEADPKALNEASKVEKLEGSADLQPAASGTLSKGSADPAVPATQTVTVSAPSSQVSTTTEHTFAKPSSRTTTPKPQSPSNVSLGHPTLSDVKQQPKAVPVSAYFAGQITEAAKQGTSSSAPSPVITVQAKAERRLSFDAGMHSASPYPQSKTPIQTPTLQDSPTKTPSAVTRSLSVGAALSEQATGKTPHTPPMDPKHRRLSVDSQVLQMQTPSDTDVKPPLSMSPTQAHVRQVIYQSSRRARLFDHSQPPPPYPSVSHGVTQTAQGFMYPQIGPRGQVMQIPGPRSGVMSPGGTQTFIRTPSPGLHGSGMLAFPFDGSTQRAVPAGLPLGQPHSGFPAGVHRVQGLRGQHPPGAYIELRHTNQSDPATRRQNILRMTNVAMASTASPQNPPAGQPTSNVAVTTQVKQTEVLPESSEAKAEDPFAGGHLPHDEHLDALLRSDEFKHLHFQGPPSASNVLSSPKATETSSAPSSAQTNTSSSVTKPITTDAKPVSQTTDPQSTKQDLEGSKKQTAEKSSPETSSLERKSDPSQTEEKKLSDASTPAKGNDENLPKDDDKEALKSEHSYSKSDKIEEGKSDVEPSIEIAKADVEKSMESDQTSKTPAQEPRGVGLTPPPEAEVRFLPTEEEPAKQDTPVNLTVSNVITVPGTPTPPVTQPTDKSPLDSANKDKGNDRVTSEDHQEDKNAQISTDNAPQTEEKLDGKVVVPTSLLDFAVEEVEKAADGNVNSSLSSAYELPPLPKSPVAPPMVQKLSKFAKIPDVPRSTVLQKDNEKSTSETKMQAEEVLKASADDSQSKMDVDVPAAGSTDSEVPATPDKVDNIESNEQSKMEVDEKCNKAGESVNTETMSVGQVEKGETTTFQPSATLTTSATAKGESTTQPSGVEDKNVMEEKPSKGDLTETATASAAPDKLADRAEVMDTTGTTKSLPVSGSGNNQTMLSEISMATTADIDPKSLATVITTTLPTGSLLDHHGTAGSATSLSQNGIGQRVEPTITVVHTSIATVTAYKQPVPPQTTAVLNQTPGAQVSAAYRTTSQPQQLASQTQLGTQQTSAASAKTPDVPKTPVRPVGPHGHAGTTSPAASMQQTHTSPTKDESKVTPPRQKPLLIKEQPLILQDLLEEERREQEKARREKMRHTQTLMQQQVPVPQPAITPGVYAMHGADIEKVTPEGGIDTIKMEFLSRMNQAAQVGLSVVPPSGTEGGISGQSTGAMHQQPQPWTGHMVGHQQAGTSTFGNEAELRKYRNWLIQQQQLMQIAVQKQEQLVQQKKTRKQSLMKKRNQYKRNGKEFSAEDTEELKVVTKQYTEAQQQLEKLRNDQKQHAELIQDFNLRQRHMIGSMASGGPTTMMQQQAQIATGMEAQNQQQQIVIQQHPGASPMPQQQQQGQQIIVPPFQTQAMQPGTQNISQQQIVMMQPGQQQVIIQSIPASSNIPGAALTTATSVTMGMQQQPHVVMTNPQQQGLVAQFQKVAGIRSTNPAQLQQIMISQHQLQQQQQLQQMQQQQKLQQQQQQQQQQAMKTAHSRPPLMQPQSTPTVQPVSIAPTGSETHDAFLQMQMQQLMALQIEQQQHLAARAQNPEKPKPKRRRRKKKSQAEKDEEEHQALLAQQQQQQQQQQQMQQAQLRGPAPTAGWQQRPPGPTSMQQPISAPPQLMHARFSVPQRPPQMHPNVGNVPPNVMPTPQSHSQNLHSMTPNPALTTHPPSSVPSSLSMPYPHNLSHTPTAVPSQVAVALPANAQSVAPPIRASTTPTSAAQPQHMTQIPPMTQMPNSTLPSPSTMHPAIPMAQSRPMSSSLSGMPVRPPSVSQSGMTQPMQHTSSGVPMASATIGTSPTMTKHIQTATSVMQASSQASVTPVSAVTGPKVVSALPGISESATHATTPTSLTQASMSSSCSKSTTSDASVAHVPKAPVTPLTPANMAAVATRRSTPRNQSPGHSLSEAELAILMAHDPDLNEERVTVTPQTTAQVPTPPRVTATPDQDDKSPIDDAKKKRPKKGFVMDQKTVDSIDHSIENVIRLSAEYEDKLQAAKEQEGAPATPTPWELDPKPTKFPPKKTPEMPRLGPQDGMKGMLGQTSMQFVGQGVMQGMPPDIMAYNQMQPGMPMGMMPFAMKPPGVEGDPSQKKKRSRRGSKEVGPDGKPIKRRRKKSVKNGTQPQQFQIGAMVDGNMQGIMMQSVRPTLQGGKPGVMAPMVPFPSGIVTSCALTVGQLSPGQPGTGDMTKVVSQWKQLPLLRLIEPEIRKSHHMCVPKGTGVTECKNFIKGLLGEPTYSGVPDFYNLVFGLSKKMEKILRPRTPPPSQPSVAGQAPVSVAKMEPVISQSLTDKSAHATTASSNPPSERYGPLGLTPMEKGVSKMHQPTVKVPDSLPTPPHQGIEDKDDMIPGRPHEDVLIPPSSPEMEDEDDWVHHSLASLRNNEFPLISKTSPDFKSERNRELASPTIPIMNCQKIEGGLHLNDKDAVSVTVEFDNTNIESIEKNLMWLSRILEAPIISYTMMKTIKPDKKLKEALRQSVKEEQSTPLAIQTSPAEQVPKTQPEDSSLPQPRTCTYCKSLVTGNGVRRPQFKGSAYEEDVLYCNKDCYIKCELLEKKVRTPQTKKKFKASHVYQRQTQKISMAALLEQFPEEEPITPSKNTRSSIDTFHPSGVQDPLKGLPPGGRGRGRRRGPGDEPKTVSKKWKGVKWKKWTSSTMVIKPSTKPPIDVEALLAKYGSALKAPADSVDKRTCVFCGGRGDGDTHTLARLLNVDVDRWVHLNCALWSTVVYETQGGALINVDLALRRSESVLCCLCQKNGATIQCHRPKCINTYHCQCALDIKCVFFKDKTVLCPTHAPKPGVAMSSTGFGMHQHHHSGDILRSLAVYRKVYVQRPETKQIASIMQQGELTQGEKNYVLRVGALIFENVGQLATHQMAACHSKTAIYPIGYKATRMYWSPTNMRRRCRYECSIREVDGSPRFSMSYKPALPGKNKPDKIVTHVDTVTTIENADVNYLWLEILNPLEKLRSQHSVLKLFPAYIDGEKLCGLTAPVVSRILESLPNIELCSEYKFRYGRTPLLELPLAINPTGCARSEPHIKQHRKKPHTLISNLISEYYESSGIGDASSLYGKQFVHSKSSQYRRMKADWRGNVYLARSRIQGLGLFAARDIEPGTMVIEYIGDIIRTEVSEKREKMYEAANRGVYMFRLDSDHIVDATVTGGPARYINHSCKPNCVAEVVNFEKEKKIMIVSNRHILKGEELSYDYKFDFEDEGRKIPCLCGASNCKKWMN